MLEKCVLTVLELNWNQRLGHWRTELNICHRMLTTSTQLQNRSFHVVERTRTSSRYQMMKNARAKRAKILFFIVKKANLSGFCCRRRRRCLSALVLRKGRQTPFLLLHFLICPTFCSWPAPKAVFVRCLNFSIAFPFGSLQSLIFLAKLRKRQYGRISTVGASKVK